MSPNSYYFAWGGLFRSKHCREVIFGQKNVFFMAALIVLQKERIAKKTGKSTLGKVVNFAITK